MEMYKAVREYLNEHGLKQKFVAEKIGFNAKVFNAMMNGRRKMYADDLAAICIALQVPVDTFVRRGYGEQG